MFVGQLAAPAVQILSSCAKQTFHCCWTWQCWISFDEGIHHMRIWRQAFNRSWCTV